MARPFDGALWLRAAAIATEYKFVIAPHEDVGFIGCTVEFPLAFGEGKTIGACVKDTRLATIAAVAVMLEHGETPPTPAGEGRREQQVNIRLSAEERFRLEQAARKSGYRSLSDFMRAAAMREAS